MFQLNRPLLDQIEYEGILYAVDMSFDNILDVFDVLEDDLSDADKLIAAMTILIGVKAAKLSPADCLGLYQVIMSNLVANGESISQPVDLNGDPMPVAGESKGPQFSFKQDAEYIWVSFIQAYHMDLHEEFGRLDWRKFLIMFRDLPSETKFKQVLSIRRWKPHKGDSNEAKKKMRELQAIYRLKSDDD